MIALLPVLLFAVLLAAEEFARAGGNAAIDRRRIASNWGLGAANWLIALLVPLSAILATRFPSTGLIAALPPVIALPLLLGARTLGTYALHRLAHVWAPLWAVHRLHHSDAQVDLSTALRNHPVEALLSAAQAAGITLLLGASTGQVILIDAILFSAVLWHHAAIRLPAVWSARIEAIVVTPRFHLLHHSTDPRDHGSNFGDLLTLWDRLFRTSRAPDGRVITVGIEPIAPASETGFRSARQTAR